MSLCINPNCLKPENPDNILFCQACGSELILQGRYRAIIELGRGGFGVTYQINEIGKNQTKVLKVLTNNQPKAIELFKQEAAVLSQLNHPGIPKVETDAYFVYFPQESRNPIHCFVMENIEGIDLEKYMQNRKDGIKQPLAIYLLKDLVIILEQVHNQNFFHRDIKPSNIMLRAENAQPVLIDFGTVRQVTETVVNQSGQVGDFPPNAFGLYDMHGNVWEWCQDDWHDNYTNAPQDGSAWISQSGNAKILRGGSWGNNPDNSRSAYRNTHSFDYNLHLIGFRVVCGGAVRV